MQNLPIKFPNKKGILVSTPTLLKYMSLFLKKIKLGFGSDTYLPFGPKSRFLLFFFGRRPLDVIYVDENQNLSLTFFLLNKSCVYQDSFH